VNRLATAVAAGNSTYNLTYSYDQYGNGTCVQNGGAGLCPQLTFAGSTNHISQIGNTPVSYDAAGEVTSDGQYNYQYDAEGRLVKVTNSPPATWYQVSVYNALGEHVEDDFPDGQYNRTLIFPRDIFGHRTEIFDDRPSQNWVGADQWWARVAGLRLLMGGSTSYLRHADATGSSTMLTDQTGAVDGDVVFYPWGQVWQISGGSDGTFGDLGFQVNYPLPPSATRDYNPTLGRWLVPDPAGQMAANPANPQTWNMYAYATDNPTTLNDPSGLLGWEGADCNKTWGEGSAEVTQNNSFTLYDKVGASAGDCSGGIPIFPWLRQGPLGSNGANLLAELAYRNRNAMYVAAQWAQESTNGPVIKAPPPPYTPQESFRACMAGEMVNNFLGGGRAGLTVALHVAVIVARQGSGTFLPGPGWLYTGTAIVYDVAMVAKAYATCKQELK